jgi:hypothetical protein
VPGVAGDRHRELLAYQVAHGGKMFGSSRTIRRGAVIAAAIVGSAMALASAAVAQGAGDTLRISYSARYSCQAALVTGSIFVPDSGKTAFELRGGLVDSTGKSIVGKAVTLWPLTAAGTGLFLGSPNKTNPESITDDAGRFSLSTAAINEDFNVVIGFDINEQGSICSIVPLLRNGKPYVIRLAGVPTVVDLGRILVK